MKALVTGGGGFLGRWVVAKLRARGDEVRVLGRRDYTDLAGPGVETVRADLGDAAAVQAACAGVDAVLHLAARVGVWGRRSGFYAANVVGTENVISACKKHGIGRLVHVSTPSVVFGRTPIEGGNESLPYPEKHLSPYPETKAIAERRVIAANGEGGLLTCSLRPHLVWGPGDIHLVPRIVSRARKGRLRRIGDGTNRVGVVYVENAADAVLLAADRLTPGSPVPGRCYFLTEPEPVNCWEFVGAILEGFGCPPVEKAVSVRTAYRIGAVCEAVYGLLRIAREPPMTRFVALQLGISHWFDVTNARRDLGWHSAVSIEEGLRRLFAHERDGAGGLTRA